VPDARAVEEAGQPTDGAACSGSERYSELLDAMAKGYLRYSDYCHELDPMSSNLQGGVVMVLDSDGQVVGLRSADPNEAPLSQETLDAALASLANDRWPCLAGQTVRFFCTSSLIP
jgi:hypothetical protein